jgi:hypothetical protein
VCWQLLSPASVTISRHLHPKLSTAVAGTIQSNQRGATGGDKSSPDRAINCTLVEANSATGAFNTPAFFNAPSNKITPPKLEGTNFGWCPQLLS